MRWSFGRGRESLPAGPRPLFGLTARAKVRRTPGQDDAFDAPAAAHAGLARAAVDEELLLILALQPRPADVVADTRAALLDGSCQHRGDGLAQAAHLGRVQVAAETSGVQPR